MKLKEIATKLVQNGYYPDIFLLKLADIYVNKNEQWEKMKDFSELCFELAEEFIKENKLNIENHYFYYDGNRYYSTNNFGEVKGCYGTSAYPFIGKILTMIAYKQLAEKNMELLKYGIPFGLLTLNELVGIWRSVIEEIF